MQGAPVRVTVRLSSSSGDPDLPDAPDSTRGMATRFHLPDGSATDLLAATLPCFFVRDPESFLAMNQLFRRHPGGKPYPRPARMVSFWRRHPEARRALFASATARPAPSFANCRFNAIHAFRWIDREGGSRYVRCSWLPVEGEARLSRSAARRVARDYLERDLRERLTGGRPLRFRLQLQLAPDGIDAQRAADPTRVWRDARMVGGGELAVEALDQGNEPIGFNPMRLCDGIEASEDRILQFRPSVYELSYRRRTSSGAAA
jgi:catalase